MFFFQAKNIYETQGSDRMNFSPEKSLLLRNTKKTNFRKTCTTNFFLSGKSLIVRIYTKGDPLIPQKRLKNERGFDQMKPFRNKSSNLLRLQCQMFGYSVLGHVGALFEPRPPLW